MKILRLELYGFKSFKDRTIVQFNQPITAIVGSNGCGKSNVVDAMYWVMGDMSPKHLRGSTMTDVIFSGTKNTAAMDMAEVTLVLERDAEKDPSLPPQFQSMDEIQITRRYYRHGESEYFINKISCRLRDIQEFFMDTGIGAKSYSIIEQGAITRMVAQKPEERRSVIEDVAGIVKFKARRAETERKLEQSKLNLQRIDDLVKDLQKQLTTLQRQADKAQKYKEWSDELRDLETRVAAREWVQRRDKLTNSKGETELTSQKLNDLESTLAQAKEELAAFREAYEAAEQDLTLARSQRQEQELKVKEKDGQIQALAIKEETLVKRRESDERTQETLNARITELDQSLVALTEALSAIEAESSVMGAEIESLRSVIAEVKTNHESLRVDFEAIRKEKHTYDLSTTQLAQEIQGYQRQTLQLEDRQQVIQETRQDIERELSTKIGEKSGAERLLNEAFSERKDLETQKEEIDGKIQGLENELTQYSEQMLKAQEELTKKKLRYHHLQDLEKNLEGIGAASRALALHMKEQKGTLYPLIADQIKVPELLEKAVEASLGAFLEAIPLEKMSEAEELLTFLRSSSNVEAKSARVKFYISDRLAAAAVMESPMAQDEGIVESTPQERPGPDNIFGIFSRKNTEVQEERPAMTMARYLREHPAVVGRLDELISQDTATSPWTRIYSNWWVVRDRNSYETLRPSIDSSVTLVSLEGDIFHPNGFIDMAPMEESLESASHLVQRKRELEELKVKVSTELSDLEVLQSKVESFKQSLSSEREAYKILTQRLVALNPGLQKHTDLIRDLEAQVARLSEKKDNIAREFELNSSKIEDLRVQLEDKNRALVEVSDKKSACEVSLADLELKVKEIEAELKEKASTLDVQQKAYSDILKKMTEEKTRQASFLQEKNLSQSRLNQLELELAEVAKTLEQLQEERSVYARERTEFQESLAQFQSEELSLDEKVKAQRKSLTQRETTISETQTALQKEFERLKNLEQDTAVNEVEIRNIEDRLAEVYQLKLPEMSEEDLKKVLAPSDIEEEVNPTLNKEKVERLRSKIERLGKINMVAMEEYQELAKRYEYLYVQKQDLSDAIKSLYEAIERFDAESKERFKESFDAVNQAFQTTFPLMFGGGQAELRLTDPENLLETGVEIVAQPPGKKLQSVTLLSGGEKALTAVSLIFGIFSIKPSPFAVLDEVDAPLDDTNVGRFNQQVRRMSEGSQIIMITHHKKTMESADALYGVTMEDPGISKVASARLSRI